MVVLSQVVARPAEQARGGVSSHTDGIPQRGWSSDQRQLKYKELRRYGVGETPDFA